MGTVTTDGRPHSVGIAYGASFPGAPFEIYVMARRHLQKARNIAANPNVSLVVPLTRRLLWFLPPPCIQLQGQAEILELEARGFGSTPAPSSHRAQAAPVAVAGQAAAANRLPAWIEQEITPKTAPRLLQDDIIRNAGAAAPAALPSWIMQEITPKAAPRLLQDDIVRSATPATSAISVDLAPHGDW